MKKCYEDYEFVNGNDELYLKDLIYRGVIMEGFLEVVVFKE